MKILVGLIFLVGFCNCVDDSKTSESYRREYVGDDYKNDGSYHGYRDRVDRNNHIIYPCNLRDIHCIQRVFGYNSRCSPAEGPRGDSINLKRLPLDIPHANLSIIMNDAQIKGIRDWKIKEFYINKATDRLVLEVEFDRIVISTSKATIRFYRKGQEPVELTDVLIIQYNKVSLTLTAPNDEDIQLSRGNVYTYLPEAFPKYSLGSQIYSSHDPEIIAAVAELTDNVSVGIKEAFLTQGPLILSVFLQNNLCNYGYS